YSYQRFLRPASKCRIAQQFPFHLIFACRDAASPLVPVEHQGLLVLVLQQIPVDRDGTVGRGHRDRCSLQGLPSRSRKTVLGRVDRFALSLVIVVPDVHADGGGSFLRSERETFEN